MDDFDKIEYEQLSQDWRHRDVLTWQFPSVLILVGGVLVAQAFDLSGEHPWIRSVLLGLGAGLATCLTIALRHNLELQQRNKEAIKALLEKDEKDDKSTTTRFDFPRLGSKLLLRFSMIVCGILIVLFFGAVCDSIHCIFRSDG